MNTFFIHFICNMIFYYYLCPNSNNMTFNTDEKN